MRVADATWLAAQRWFRAKQRPIAAVEVADRAELADGATLEVLEVAYADDGGPDRYLVPTVAGREPVDGEGAWAAIVRLMADGGELSASHGRFVAGRTEAFEALVPAELTERRLTVEQSNTSVRVGGTLILKLYRLLEPGENPELEMSAFLTEVDFADTPRLAGGMTYESESGVRATAAMLQEFVPGVGDGWSVMRGSLTTEPAMAIRQAATVGAVTASLHAALASRPDRAGFPARPSTVAETAAWRAAAERQLSLAVNAVAGDAHRRLVQLAPKVTARFADTFGRATGSALVTRVHGDYHLGQLVARADGGYSVIDFEGEPARTLSERRQPGSPMRDVAGMLRSLDYAARTVAQGELDPDAWLAEARPAYLASYGRIGPDDAALLDAFELEKACYEVRYEAGNRPEWVGLPLAAIERLVGA